MKLTDQLPGITPLTLLGRWPRQRRLLALLSGQVEPVTKGTNVHDGANIEGAGTHGVAESRWSILTEPDRTITGAVPGSLVAKQPRARAANEPPFDGGHIGYIGYDFARSLHPKAITKADTDFDPADATRWAPLEFHRCPAALCHDARTGAWWLTGDQFAAEKLLQMALACLGDTFPATAATSPAFSIGAATTTWSRDGYIAAVLAAKEHIAKGDIYQLNLTHVLAARFCGSARALMATLHERTSAWFGVYLESPDYFSTRRIMCCQSPELFLSIIPQADGTMLVQTRPMKGTRPLMADAAADSLATTDLDRSEKENAELTMIIDLMRNDLGRVCTPGSVHVTDRRTIERHGRPGTGVLQATATVCGTLAAGGKVADVLDATLPGGSITGAPKLRAMQLIAELEPHRRGPYCGVVGYFSNCGRVELAMAIRTALLRGPRPNPALGEELRGEVDTFSPLAPAVLEYPVGAGIVADSVPEAEWEETLAKAKVLDGLVG